jgi:DNA-binding response OmpR family regulator
MDKVKKILIISSDKKLKDVLNFCFDGWGYDVILHDAFPEVLSEAVEAIKKFSPDVIVIDVKTASKEQLDLCRCLKNDFATALVPVITLIDKRQLRNQLLTLKQGVDDYLIKPPDPLDLRIRIEMVLRRSHHSVYASSLTGLPGGKILEDAVKERMASGKDFSFIYIDIDNFKYFNDVYGYQKGDRVLLQTAYMLFAVLRRLGNNDDFISHIGGDDFAIITTEDKYENICKYFIEMFDNLIPFHYALGDRQKGFIVARDRSRVVKKISLMSVSIAVVNKNSVSLISSPIVLNERIAEIKRYLKTIPGSKFMADRRDMKIPKHLAPQVYQKKPDSCRYKPLGQILLEKQKITYEQLDEALHIHWRKGICLGETLKDLGYLDQSQVVEALNLQRQANAKVMLDGSSLG